jgi:hypothetical protein
MNHALLAELFHFAGKYHGALADYAAAMRARGDIESAAQAIVGTSLRYRVAIDRLLAHADVSTLQVVASRSRLERLRTTLAHASRQYNLVNRAQKPRPPRPNAGRGAQW